jgi:hypothetical protein
MVAVHMSSRILLVIVAGAAIVGGWWILFAINEVPIAVIYSALWTICVLVAARTLLALGLGYNRLTAKGPSRPTRRTPDSAADLRDLRDRGVISKESYEREQARSSDDSDHRTG